MDLNLFSSMLVVSDAESLSSETRADAQVRSKAVHLLEAEVFWVKPLNALSELTEQGGPCGIAILRSGPG